MDLNKEKKLIVITDLLLQHVAGEHFKTRLTEQQLNVCEEVILENLQEFLKDCVRETLD